VAAVTLLADARGALLGVARGRLVSTERGSNALRLVDVDADDDSAVDAATGWTAARLGTGGVAPTDVIVDGDGFIVAHEAAHCGVRLGAAGVAAATPLGGRCGVRGDGQLLDGPSYLARPPVPGALYVSDTKNHRVVRRDVGGGVSPVIGDGSPSTAGAGAPARVCSVNAPRQLAVGSYGNLFIAATRAVRLVANVDGDGDAGGDDRVVNIFGNGDRTAFPDRDATCFTALALADDRSVYIADDCLGILVHLSPQRVR